MRKLLIFVIPLIMNIFNINNASALSLENYITLKKQSDSTEDKFKAHLAKVTLDYFLEGVAEAEASSESMSRYKNQGVSDFSRYGCVPGNPDMDAYFVREMVDRYLFNQGKKVDPTMSVALAYVVELSIVYPCKAGNDNGGE